MEIFGFKIERKKDEEQEVNKSFANPIADDGAVTVATGGTFGTYIDLEGTIRTEAELVTRYREMSLQPEVDKAVNEVVNEAIVVEEENEIVELILDDMPVAENIKKVIIDEFENILNLCEFKKNSYDMFKRWYIDGRSYYHAIVNEEIPQEGLKELRYIDPRKIRKIREIKKIKDPITQAVLTIVKDEYYIYTEKGLNSGTKGFLSQMGTSGLKIKKDSIIHTTSGLLDSNNKMVLSYLHPSIKQLNQLRALEDATLIYHLSRAPERRVFYIDVGNLPKAKAEQHVQNMMTRHKNKIQYNAQTGEIKDDRKFMTMLEDYWLPRREGRGTEISVLQGGTALPQLLESLQYFQDRLYRALQVPLTRMKPDAIYNIGRATEITRDEVNFSKFIDRVRNKFSDFFLSSLEKQLILKEIVDPESWEDIKKHIKFQFAKDNYFTELKEMEILNERFIRLRDVDDFAGRYYSHEWIRRNILKQTDDDIEKMDKQIQDEFTRPQYNPEAMAELQAQTFPNAIEQDSNTQETSNVKKVA
jgi:hypothetical protein